MGIHKNVGYDFFPKQNFVGREVMVYFHYDPDRMIPGTIVRNDVEKPDVTIIQLSDGRFVLDTECFYEEFDKSKAKENVRYKIIEIKLDKDTKHAVVGSISARNYLDMSNYPHNVVNEGEIITEDAWKKMISQGRESVEIKEIIEVVME